MRRIRGRQGDEMARNKAVDLYRLLPNTTEQYESSEFAQRSNAALKSAMNLGPVMLIAKRTEEGIQDYIAISSSPSSKNAADSFASAVGAEAVIVDDLGLRDSVIHTLGAKHIARGTFPQGSIGAERSTQANTDYFVLPRVIVDHLNPGSFFAVSMRPPTTSERRSWAPWFKYATGGGVTTHPSLDSSSTIVEFYTGDEASKSEALSSMTEIVEAMPGFDAMVTPRPLGASRGFIKTALLSLLAFVLGATVPERLAEKLSETGGKLSSISEYSEQIASGLGTILFILGWILAADTVLRFFRIHKSRGLRARGNLVSLRAPVGRRRWRAKPPREEKIDPQTGRIVTKEFPGDYPLLPHSIRTAPSVYASAFSPRSGVVGGESRTTKRQINKRFTDKIGPLIAEVGDQSIHISAAAASFGTSFLGSPGSGKSQTLRSIFGFSILERVAPSGLPGFPGRNNTLIAIENKGPDGAAEYLEWASTLGDDIILVDAADDSTSTIDLLSNGENIGECASNFVNLMKSGWSEGEIGARATTSLTRTIAASLVVDNHIIDIANRRGDDLSVDFPKGESPLVYAHIFLGGWVAADDDAIRLYDAIKEAAAAYDEGDETIDDESGEEYKEALAQLSYLFGKRTPAQRSSLIESSENKIFKLLEIKGFFGNRRTMVDLPELIENHQSIVINLGPSISGKQVGSDVTGIVSAMITRAIQEAVANTCSGWQAQNRWVSLFGDELSLLAGSSPEVVIWFREQGRSFGVRTFFATQRPNQLDDNVRESFLSSDTLLAYRQSSAGVVDAVLAEISMDGEDWSESDITKLPDFSAIIRTSIDGVRQNSIVAKMIDFESDRYQFAARQGAQSAPAPIPVASGQTENAEAAEAQTPAAPTAAVTNENAAEFLRAHNISLDDD